MVHTLLASFQALIDVVRTILFSSLSAFLELLLASVRALCKLA
jgi:hypothetical protein